MKLMEYFYMGKPVITTNIEEAYRYNGLVRIASTANEFANQIIQIQRFGWDKKIQIQERRRARENSWKNKFEAISDALEREFSLRQLD